MIMILAEMDVDTARCIGVLIFCAMYMVIGIIGLCFPSGRKLIIKKSIRVYGQPRND